MQLPLNNIDRDTDVYKLFEVKQFLNERKVKYGRR